LGGDDTAAIRNTPRGRVRGGRVYGKKESQLAFRDTKQSRGYKINLRGGGVVCKKRKESVLLTQEVTRGIGDRKRRKVGAHSKGGKERCLTGGKDSPGSDEKKQPGKRLPTV